MSAMVSDEVLGIFVPVIVYWVYSGMYEVLGSSMDDHRLFTRAEEAEKNLVSKGEVVRGVLLEQFFQVSVLGLLFKLTGRVDEAGTSLPSSPAAIAMQVAIALLVMDAWQYWWHRALHMNRFLYKHVHQQHHRLVVPYAYGSQYNHPVEGFINDVLGGTVSFLLSGMSPRTSMFFYSLATVKAIDDHCGLWFPNHPFHRWFRNNSAFHAVHHQLYGGKFNFSSPFLVVWDKLLGTYLPYTVQRRSGGAAGWEIVPHRVPSNKDQ